MSWNDSLLWSIRPDCEHDARAMVQRLDVSAAGLHRDNLWKQYTSRLARALDMDQLPIDIDGEIGVVTVDGPLVNQVNPFTANYPLLTASFDRMRTDGNIAAVIVRFRTPGGTVSGLHSCASALNALAETKLTIAQNDGGCYSAGYYLASQCGTICSEATDHIGNIGTVLSLYDFSEMFAKQGVRTIVKRTGPIKGLGIMGDEITTAQEMVLQELCDEHFSHFRAAVQSGRGMDDDQFAAVSDGRWWTGETALTNGIIDQVSSYSETLAQLKALYP